MKPKISLNLIASPQCSQDLYSDLISFQFYEAKNDNAFC